MLRVRTRACRFDARFAQGVQCFDTSGFTPIQDVIVREDAAIDLGRRQAGHVLGMHPVVDSLWCRVVALRDCCLEVDDARVGSAALELAERIAPDVREGHGLFDRAVLLFRQADVLERALRVRLVDAGMARVTQGLIDAPTCHYVTGQKERQALAPFRAGQRRCCCAEGCGSRHLHPLPPTEDHGQTLRPTTFLIRAAARAKPAGRDP